MMALCGFCGFCVVRRGCWPQGSRSRPRPRPSAASRFPHLVPRRRRRRSYAACSCFTASSTTTRLKPSARHSASIPGSRWRTGARRCRTTSRSGGTRSSRARAPRSRSSGRPPPREAPERRPSARRRISTPWSGCLVTARRPHATVRTPSAWGSSLRQIRPTTRQPSSTRSRSWRQFQKTSETRPCRFRRARSPRAS